MHFLIVKMHTLNEKMTALPPNTLKIDGEFVLGESNSGNP